MTAISLVSPDWLALRASADAAARSRALAADAAGALGPGPLVVHDLGSGTGAMLRWLAPRLPGPQSWVLHDGDPGILDHLDPRTVVDASGVAVSVRTSVEDIAELPADVFAGASLVTASALLDVLTREEVSGIVARCVAAGVPAMFSLSVTGRVDLDPADGGDETLEAAFDDHQRRLAHGRRLLGPDAAHAVSGMFAAEGWRIRIEPTPWRLGPDDRVLIEGWLDGWLDAAVQQRPDLRDQAASYRMHRLAQLAEGGLEVVVHHEDLLACPE